MSIRRGRPLPTHRHQPTGFRLATEQLEQRLPMAVDSTTSTAPVDPNNGSIEQSQFNPYGTALLGGQLQGVAASGGVSLAVDAPNNTGFVSVPSNYVYPSTAVNSGRIDGSQFIAGGATGIGLQLDGVSISGGGLNVLNSDAAAGLPSLGGSQPGPAGANPRPALLPPGSPGGPVNSGIVSGSQFVDGGFGQIGVQARDLTVGGDVTILADTQLGTAINRDVVPYTPPQPALSVNSGTITGSQFVDGGFGDTGLQWSKVTVGKTVDVAAKKVVVQPTPGNAGPPTLLWKVTKGSRVVTFSKGRLNPGQNPTDTLYPGMYVFGQGIAAKTTILSIKARARQILLSKPARANGIAPLYASTNDTGTNTGAVLNSQFVDGGFGDIGMQWSKVNVGGRVATLHAALEIQPEIPGHGPITTGGQNFGLPATQTRPGVLPGSSIAGPPYAPSTPTPTTPSAGNDATNSGRVIGSQFTDGGFGDIGMQWMNVRVSNDVTAVHNSLSIQPENSGQGLITVADVRFASAAPALSGMAANSPAQQPSPPTITSGQPFTPTLPTPTAPTTGGSPGVSDSATNSGIVSASQFADGGFGDVGMQWLNVVVNGSVSITHNSLSIQPEGSRLAGVTVKDIVFGSPTAATGGDPRLAGRTLATATFGQSGMPPFVPDPALTRYPNSTPRIGEQFASSPATATSLKSTGVSYSSTGLVIVNNVLKVSVDNGSKTPAVRLNNITLPGSLPPTQAAATVGARRPPHPLALRSARLLGQPAPVRSVAPAPRPQSTNSATNSGTILSNQFLDGGTGDIGMQWQDVTVNGSVNVQHNSFSINVDGDAVGTGPITVSNVQFNSGLSGSGSMSDLLLLTPSAGRALTASTPGSSISGSSTSGSPNAASNSSLLSGGQFLDGGQGSIGLQWRNVTVNCPLTVVNNVFSITVSGRNTGLVTVNDVTFS